MCPLCPSSRFETSIQMSDHTSMRHVSEVPPERHETFVRLCHTTSLDRVGGKCPLCFNFETQNLDQYQIHIVDHLERAASSVFPEFFTEF